MTTPRHDEPTRVERHAHDEIVERYGTTAELDDDCTQEPNAQASRRHR